MADIEIVQDVVVFGVRVAEPDVHVSVYGGPTNACGAVHFTFSDPEVRARKVSTLRRWQRQGTVLTLVVGPSSVALRDHSTLLAELLDAS